MRKRFILLLIVLIATCSLHDVFAFAEEDVTIMIDGQDVVEKTFEGALGSVYNGTIIITAPEDEDVTDVVIKTQVPDPNVSSQSLTVLFYSDDLEPAVKQRLEDNNDDIVTFCSIVTDGDEKQWCDGLSDISVELTAGEVARIPMTVRIPSDTDDQVMEFLIVSGDETNQRVITKKLNYRVPDKNIAELTLRDVLIERSFGPMNIGAWLAAQMKDVYIARGTINNVGTEDVEYTFFAQTRSLWTDEMMTFEQQYSIGAGEEQKKEIALTMPRFGKVEIVGGVRFNDAEGSEKDIRSEIVTVTIWPVVLLVSVILIICFCVICVLLYKYIRKNMFRFKKNKKEKDAYTGSYIVKDTDNIISIAQMYDVPWKELAQRNNIDPPYILISGESIAVPENESANDGDRAKEIEEKVVQKDVEMEEDGGNDIHDEDEEMTSPVQPAQMDGRMYQKKNDLSIDEESVVAQERSQNDIPTKAVQMQRTSAENISRPKKRKVSYAAPQNMLTRPSSEPTMRAIDIEWMRDDEEAYSEEMEQQQKQINIRLFAMMGIGVITIIAIVWFAGSWILRHYQRETVSVEELIQPANDEESVMIDQEQQVGLGSVDNAEEQSDEESGGDDAADAENAAVVVDPSDITVLVLNGGAQTGAAGTISQIFTEKGYEVKDPQNAQNSYNDVTVFYGKDAKDIAEKIASEIAEQYGEQTLEESDDVVQRYDVDIVVVLGA